MRLVVIILISLVTTELCYRQLRGQHLTPEDRTEVEFYIAGYRQPQPRYRVRHFRRVGANSSELAGSFQGLAARDLEPGEYEYALEPEIPPAGPPGSFSLTGKVQLYGSFPHWITLQMPNGVLADMKIGWISGRVLPAPAAKENPIWIRFQHLVDHSQFFQTKLGADGNFRIPNPSFDGNVVITVCRGDAVLIVEVAHFTAGHPDHPLELRANGR